MRRLRRICGLGSLDRAFGASEMFSSRYSQYKNHGCIVQLGGGATLDALVGGPIMDKKTVSDGLGRVRFEWRGFPETSAKFKRNWKDIWEDRHLDPAQPTLLAQLLAADGYDSGFADFDEARYRTFVAATGRTLGVTPTSSIFEVGCGAGAFLLPFQEAGCPVGGLDLSPSLIEIARDALPGAELVLGQATALDPLPPYDIVVSCGVFHYFPSLSYAREVLGLMLRKARCAIAVLDLPDAAQRKTALAMRRGRMGCATYERHYSGLNHLFIAREWIQSTLIEFGARKIIIRDQSIFDCPNAAFRYNVFAWRTQQTAHVSVPRNGKYS
jgi:SAM-dependent methyltransferase